MTDAVKPATDGVVISRELLAFLCGDGPLDGHYFGEKPDHERGNFWWRKALRAAENAAIEKAGEPVDQKAEYEAFKMWAKNWLPDAVPTVTSHIFDAWLARARVPTLQRLGQEFDAGEAVVSMYERNPDVHLTIRAHPPQSRGQAFDGEGEGFTIGDPVEKFTGEAIWHGVIVASYLTSKGKRRYVVEVKPQGFQMIAVPSQLRALSSAKRGEA
ncbi:hypothetical protein CP98_03635 [Sphingobium yanoikuyae]|uniref:Uncharacterized protein n=1 Tax=Sphingobium yanoikuyae TaxID=13690 RepID=A0A084EGP5_SPHYA|nr:hypothetical protein [Sphingobium yanoikuyae]KEZ17137.1 hypothetical protein CP98_03635 [Sphingobium yanoikuyae]